MTDFLQIILAARKKGSGWFEVLIPIAIFVVYALSGIIKATRKGQNKPSERQTGKPRYKPLDKAVGSREAASSSSSASSHRKHLPYAPSHTQPAQRQQERGERRIAHIEHQSVSQQRQQPVAQRPRPVRPVAQRPVPAVKARPKPRPIRKADTRLRKEEPSRSPKPSVAKPVVGGQLLSLENLAESNNLRTAIVFSEILGKPLALRKM